MANPTKTLPAIAAEVMANGILQLDFANGEQLRIDPAALSDTIRMDAMLHGLKQKLVDAAAIARNKDTGRSATIDDKFDAVKEIYDRITSPNGTWNKVRGDGTAGSGLLVRALMQLMDKTRSEIEAFLEPKSKEQRAALMVNPRVAPIIAQLKAQSVDKDVDSDAMLEELEALGADTDTNE